MAIDGVCWNCKYHAKYENTWEGICVNPKSKEFLEYSKNYHNVGLSDKKKDYPCFCEGDQVIGAEEMHDFFESFVKEGGYFDEFKKYLLNEKDRNGNYIFREE